MTVYVFGNQDVTDDAITIKFIKPNEDVKFDSKNPIILDTVDGLTTVKLFKDINKIISKSSTTVHDFDLGFQLNYLKKIGKITGATIIGVPRQSSKN